MKTRALVFERFALETRLGLFIDDRPVAIAQETPLIDRGPRAGAIYRAKAGETTPDRRGQFFDIGEGEAFLPLGKSDRPHPQGARLLVQIRREREDGKSPIITADAKLVGPFAVLSLSDGEATVSTRIKGGEREDLRAVAAKAASGRAVAVRSEAAGRSDALAADIARLSARARGVSAVGDIGLALGVDAPIADALAQWGASGLELAGADRELSQIAELYDLDAPMTEHENDLDEAFEFAASDHAAMPGGGALWFERTRAFIAVDVDLGGRASSRDGGLRPIANEIMRGLRLRGLGGQVVIDFPARLARDAAAIRSVFAAASADDPDTMGRVEVEKSGLVTLTRRASARDWRTLWTAPARGTAAAGRDWSLAYRALDAARSLERALRADRSARLRLQAPTPVFNALKAARLEASLGELYGARMQMEETTDGAIDIASF